LWAVAAAVLLAPVLIFAGSLQSASGFAQLPSLYANHAGGSGVIALGSVIVSCWISLSLLYLLRVRRDLSARSGSGARSAAVLLSLLLAFVVIAQVVMAVSPPALVGDAFAAAYEKVPWLRDHWGIVSMVCAARFSIVVTAALRIAVPRQLGEMAQSDGAALWDELWRIHLPAAWKQIFAAALVVFVLSYQEIAATLLVVPPNVGNLPKTLLNAIHFGRNDAVIAMSLSLVFAAACISALVIRLIGRWNRT
jgi:ABC-type spermidine/putrescine transport system permease subunit II